MLHTQVAVVTCVSVGGGGGGRTVNIHVYNCIRLISFESKESQMTRIFLVLCDETQKCKHFKFVQSTLLFKLIHSIECLKITKDQLINWVVHHVHCFYAKPDWTLE